MKPRSEDMLPATIFIPVYNEEDILFKNIERLVSYLGRYFSSYEIMIGSNGSTDSTIKIGEKLQNSYPEVTFFHISEKGVGKAFLKRE
jgi:glycosyltransferase involved in cell wall biosynthesis